MTCFQLHFLSPYPDIQNTNCLLLLIGQSSPRVSPESVGIGVEDMLVIVASVN